MRRLMKQVPKANTDDALIQEFLNKGGKVSVGKTKPLAPELGLSKNVWNNILTKDEKAARDYLNRATAFSDQYKSAISLLAQLDAR